MSKELADTPKEKIKLKPVITVQALLEMKFTSVPGLSEEMRLALGDIEDSFAMLVYGASGSGKTTFVGQILEALAPLGLILYESFEEGARKTFKNMLVRTGLHKLAETGGLHILDGEPFEHLVHRLDKKRSAKIVVIDTIQYTDWTFAQYKILKKRFIDGKTMKTRKIFIFISHIDANGKKPDGGVAEKIRRDLDIKVKVDRNIAFIDSRFENVKNWVIWEAGAKSKWGKTYRDQLWVVAPAKKTKVKKEKEEVVPVADIVETQIAEE